MRKNSAVQPDTQRRLRAVCAVRVSHLGGRVSELDGDVEITDGKRRLISDKAQIEAARRWCALNDADLDEEASIRHKDLDVSGKKVPWRKRPGLSKHIEAARRGEIDVIIFYRLNRVGRNLADSLTLLDELQQIGTRVIGVEEGLDSANEGSYKLLRGILLTVAEHQSDELGANVHYAAVQRAKDGRIHGGGLPAWIRWEGKKPHQYPVVIEEQAAAIRRMIQLRTREALGETKIAQRLNKEGYRTVQGARWTASMINKYSESTWIDTMLGTGYLGRHKPPEERIAIPNAFQPIITQEEADAFRAVQRIARANAARVGSGNWASSRKGKPRLSQDSPYILGGLVRCACCGKSMIGCQRAGGRRNYACPQGKASRDIHPTGVSSVDKDGLEDAVLRVVRHALKSPPPPKPVDKPRDLARLPKLLEKLDRLEDIYLDGDIARDRYIDKKREIEAQIDAAREEERAQEMPEALRQAQAIPDHPTHAQLWQLAHLLVERVEAAVTIPGVKVRPGAKGDRRYAKVTLRYPTESGHRTFLAPIYTSKWAGERVIHPAEE